jgi:uncharacterized damage-inducible protein DinB
MTEEQLDALRFPIGRATRRPLLGDAERRELVDRIAELPGLVRAAVAGLDDAALDTPYRPGGWTVRQVVHHIPDSHVNAYIRFRMAATESDPTIKPYEEAEWARLADSRAPVEGSLALLDALHARWTAWLRTLDDATWRRAYVHPESGRTTLDQALQLYAWHGAHHLAHIRGAPGARS